MRERCARQLHALADTLVSAQDNSSLLASGVVAMIATAANSASARRLDDEIVIAVEDRGTGLGAGDPARLFDLRIHAAVLIGCAPASRIRRTAMSATGRELQFAMIVLDLGLPDLNGVEVVRGIRVQSQTPILIEFALLARLARKCGEGGHAPSIAERCVGRRVCRPHALSAYLHGTVACQDRKRPGRSAFSSHRDRRRLPACGRMTLFLK